MKGHVVGQSLAFEMQNRTLAPGLRLGCPSRGRNGKSYSPLYTRKEGSLQPENLGQGPHKHRMGNPAETVMDTRVFLGEPNASTLEQLKLLTKR